MYYHSSGNKLPKLLFSHSTVSSSINALTTVTVEDLIRPHANMSEKQLSWLSKGLSM